jgi:hypothetical protein
MRSSNGKRGKLFPSCQNPGKTKETDEVAQTGTSGQARGEEFSLEKHSGGVGPRRIWRTVTVGPVQIYGGGITAVVWLE